MPAHRPVAGRLTTPLALLILIAGLVLAGAGAASAEQTPPGASWLRSVHLITGAGPMQVSISPAGGGQKTVLTRQLAYGTATDYRAITPGTYTVEVQAAEAKADAPALLSSTFEAETRGAVSLTLLGSKDAPRLAVLQDDLTAPQAGQARVRVLPAASDSPQVTVTAAGGPVIAKDAVFGQPTAYASVPAGKWPLSAVAGDRRGEQAVTLSSGAVYTILIADGAAGALTVSTLQDAAGINSSGIPVAAPMGGVQTGGGGAADLVSGAPVPSGGAAAPHLLLLALAPLGLLAVTARRVLRGR